MVVPYLLMPKICLQMIIHLTLQSSSLAIDFWIDPANQLIVVEDRHVEISPYARIGRLVGFQQGPEIPELVVPAASPQQVIKWA